MKKTILSFSAIVMLVTSGCKKEETKSKEVTKENVSGTYTITKVEAKVSNSRADITTDYFRSFAEECDRDNTITFELNGIYVEKDGTMKCDPSSDSDGTWSITNSSTLSIDGELIGVESFTGNNLMLVEDYSYSGQQGKIIRTLTKK